MQVLELHQALFFTLSILFGLVGSIVLTKRVPTILYFGLYLTMLSGYSLNHTFWSSSVMEGLVLACLGPTLYGFTESFFNNKFSSRALSWVGISGLITTFTYLMSAESVFFLLILQAIITLNQIGKKSRRFSRQNGVSIFKNPGKRISWLRNFLLLQLLFWALAIIDYRFELSIWFIICILSFSILLLYHRILGVSDFLISPSKIQKYAKSSLLPEMKLDILNKIEYEMSHHKLYLNSDVNLNDVASKIKSTPHNLSQVLNEQKGTSFAEFIMQLRVGEAMQIIRQDQLKQLTVEEVALRVGYNSKSAFNVAFKRITGKTPSEFRQLKNVRDYREERLAGRTIHSYGKQGDRFDWLKNQIEMTHNFLLLFLRGLIRNQFFTAINLIGLTLGFTSSIFIYLYLQEEVSYDKAIKDSKDIYRLAWFNVSPQTRTPHPMAQAMVSDFPEVVSACSITPWYGAGLSKQDITVKNVVNNRQFEEPDFFFVDSTFLDVFGFELIAGNEKTVLKKPGGILLTPEMAEKYFGTTDPLGKTLQIGPDETIVEVVGIVKAASKATHFHFNFLISYVTLKAMLPENHFWMTWGDFGHFNYVKLHPDTEVEELKARIPDWFLGYNNWTGGSRESLLDGSNWFELQPIRDIHLHSQIRWELEPNGNLMYVYILSAAVLMILVIASINYVNLTSAKSFERAKEIGVRKAMGALKGQLTFQFLIESILFCLFAGAIAFILSWALLDDFNRLSNKAFTLTELFHIDLVMKATLIMIGIAIISGLYPSLALSSFKTTEIIHGKFNRSKKGAILNKVLVVFQFIISTILIAGSLIILKQTNYLKEKPLGFNRDHLITIPIKSTDVREKHSVVNLEISKVPGVLETTAVSNIPGGQFNQNAIWLIDQPENPLTISEMTFDYHTVDVLDLEIIDGRNFDPSYALDSAGGSFLLNESAAKQLNIDEPVGSKVLWDVEEGSRSGTIIGVIKDFHYKSLHQNIQPMIIDMRRSLPGYLLVRIETSDLSQTIEQIAKRYATLDAKHDFEYSFVDQSMAQLYDSEVRTLNIFGIFALVALLLACLGLLGLVLSIMQQKIKEVGIRKIHGASSWQILWMINSRFLKLISLAVAVGLPIAYLLMSDWMSAFAYRTPLGITPFLLSVGLLFVVALVTTSAVIVRTTSMNPSEALRHE